MLSMQISVIQLICFVIITFLFSLKDEEAMEVRFRFLLTPVIWIILMYCFSK